MNKSHLKQSIANELGYDFYRANSDYNGNPRYVIHFLAFRSDYDRAHEIAKNIGFTKYRGKDFGGGFVAQSYSLEETAKQIIRSRY